MTEETAEGNVTAPTTLDRMRRVEKAREGNGRARLTLLDIARLAGVSRTTASRVLNGRGEVSATVRARVESVIAETGYRPLASAQSLVSHRTGVIGFVIPIGTAALFQDPYFGTLLKGISHASAQMNLAVALFLFEEDSDQNGLIDRVVGPRRVDGIIMSAYHTRDSLLDRLADFDVPTVTMGPNRSPEIFGSVQVDNRQGGVLAGRRLVSAGCRRVALIGGPENTPSGAERNEGFRAAIEEGGLDLPAERVRIGDYTEKTGEALGRELLREDFDGIFVASDVMALGAMRALRSAGRRVPEDVSVVGFDDLELAALSEPPLTTIWQPITEMASAALEMLLAQIDDPGSVHHLVLPVELVERASTRS